MKKIIQFFVTIFMFLGAFSLVSCGSKVKEVKITTQNVTTFKSSKKPNVYSHAYVYVNVPSKYTLDQFESIDVNISFSSFSSTGKTINYNYTLEGLLPEDYDSSNTEQYIIINFEEYNYYTSDGPLKIKSIKGYIIPENSSNDDPNEEKDVSFVGAIFGGLATTAISLFLLFYGIEFKEDYRGLICFGLGLFINPALAYGGFSNWGIAQGVIFTIYSVITLGSFIYLLIKANSY